MDLSRPQPHDFDVHDIARGLSNCCRFAGQIPRESGFYSVAQHSLLVSSLVCPEREVERVALFHDASEAYLGDLSRNLKHHPALAGYRQIEKAVQRAINEQFNSAGNKEIKRHVKLADNAAAICEHVLLRERRPLTRRVIDRLLEQGFVKNSYKELKPFLDRLPESLEYMAGPLVEALFVDECRRAA